MISFGYVCSLDALPLMAAAGVNRRAEWGITPCSGYGSIIRQLNARRLSGGLLPLDIFAREFLSTHTPVQPWRILTLQAAQPRELVISNAARNLLKPTQHSSTLPFRVALDGLQAGTQRAVEDWVKKHAPHLQTRTIYRVLPLNTFHQGMQTSMIEAFAAPAPWGLMAAHQDLGTLQESAQSSLTDGTAMALVIDRHHSAIVPTVMKQIHTAHALLSSSQGINLAVELLAAPTPCPFPSDVLQDALAKAPHLPEPVPASIAKITAHLAQLIKNGLWGGNALSNEKLAQSLSTF